MVVQVYLMTLIGPVRTMKKNSVCWGLQKKIDIFAYSNFSFLQPCSASESRGHFLKFLKFY